MIFSKKTFLTYIAYIAITTMFFLQANYKLTQGKTVALFFKDSNIKYEIESALALDPNTGSVVIPRMFHNKASYAVDSFTNSIYQAIDPVFLFSLSKTAPLYVGPTDVKMLFPIELPLFILTIIYIARNWNFKRDKYFYLLCCFLTSLLIIGLILPPLYSLKLLPLVIVIRTGIFLGISDWARNQKWAKNYFS